MDELNLTGNATFPVLSKLPPSTKLGIARFQAYALIVIVLVGVIGNLISIIIFTLNIKKEAISAQYLRVLAAADAGVLLLVGLRNWLAKGLPFISGSDAAFDATVDITCVCKLVRFLEQFSIFMSSWIVVIFSIERGASVWMPLETLTVFTTRRRNIALVTMAIMAAIFKAHIPYYFDIFTSTGGSYKNCWYPPHLSEETKIAFVCLDLLMNRLMPCIIILSTNLFIIAGVTRATGWAKGFQIQGATFDSVRRRKQEFLCIFNLIAISIVYFLFMLPPCLMWVYFDIMIYTDAGRDYSKQALETLYEIARLTDSISLCNHSLNFIIYGVMLKYYQRTLVKILHIRELSNIRDLPCIRHLPCCRHEHNFIAVWHSSVTGVVWSRSTCSDTHIHSQREPSHSAITPQRPVKTPKCDSSCSSDTQTHTQRE
jgi:hypothetical protein